MKKVKQLSVKDSKVSMLDKKTNEDFNQKPPVIEDFKADKRKINNKSKTKN